MTADQLALCAAEDTELAGGVASQVGKKRAKTQEPKLWQLLTRNLLGFSPLLAREAVYRTTSDAESLLETSAAPWEELAWNVRELAALYDTHAWKPQLVERMGGDAGPAQPSPSQAFPLPFPPNFLHQYSPLPLVRLL